MLIGITGASSAFGHAVSRYLAASGHSVQRLVRVPAGVGDRSYDIHGLSLRNVIVGLDAVVHLAWERGRDPILSNRANIVSTERLAAACRDLDIRFIQISSTSVIQHSVSQYGAAKLAAEEITCNYGGVVLRPGLVWGDEMSGSPIFRQLVTVANMPMILPLLRPDPLLFHTDISTFCQLLAAIMTERIPIGPRVCAFANEQLKLSDILRTLRTRRRLMTVSLPTARSIYLLRLLNRHRWSTKVKAESLEFALSIARSDGAPSCSFSGSTSSFADNNHFLAWLAHVRET